MSYGFPDGKFRIINVGSGQCLWKEKGTIGTLDTSGTYDRPAYNSSSPTLGMREPKKVVSEAWSCESGRLVNAEYEPAGKGQRALHIEQGGWVDLTRTDNTYAEKWEFSEGLIRLQGNSKVLMFKPESGRLALAALPGSDRGGPVDDRLAGLLPGLSFHVPAGTYIHDPSGTWHWTWRLEKT